MALIRGIGGIVTITHEFPHFWNYFIGDGLDVGVATAAPGFVELSAGAKLVASDQAVSVTRREEASEKVQYLVTVTNPGSAPVAYTLNVGYFG